MIPFEEAFQIINTQTVNSETENIGLTHALNRVVAENIVSDIDMPPFNKSAMDGFACRKEDINNELNIIETIAAGQFPTKTINTNECSRIMTGAMVPNGANFVMMKEHVEVLKNGIIRRIRESSHDNICYKGEDIKKGDLVIQKDSLIRPQHIATLASVGITNPLVYKMPEIAIISTGNELVEPDTKPGLSQIRNSNGYQMLAQIQQLGLKAHYLGIAEDNPSILQSKLDMALNQSRIILISGGVSVGDYDYVPQVLKQLGVQVIFHGITAKPGKHLLFGRNNQSFIFGMPGNPVSSFIQFEILVKPFIFKIMGHAYQSFKLSMPLSCNFKRKKSEVLEFIPVFISSEGKANLLEYHGSAHISAYNQANGIMEIPIGINELKAGEIVHVRPI